VAGTPTGHAVDRRRERRIGAIGLIAAVAVPLALWHGVILAEARSFRLNWGYVSGMTPWLLMAAAILCFLPVAVSAGLSPASRYYPRGRNAFLGWGSTLYVLGFGLATQVGQMMAAHGVG
jgi:hypothetical protein